MLHQQGPMWGETAGRSPLDRGKQEMKRSVVVDAAGIPLGAVAAPANRHDSPLLAPTLGALETLGVPECPPRPRLRLEGHPPAFGGPWLGGRDLREGQAVPSGGHEEVGHSTDQLLEQRSQKACVVHREAGAGHIDFWVAFSNALIIVGRLIREAWSRYRWEGRPSRRP